MKQKKQIADNTKDELGTPQNTERSTIIDDDKLCV